MSKHLIDGVLSGPAVDGLWHWRPLTEGGASRVLPRDLGEPGWFVKVQTLQNQLVPLLSHHLGYPYGLLDVLGRFPCFVGAKKRRLRRPTKPCGQVSGKK